MLVRCRKWDQRSPLADWPLTELPVFPTIGVRLSKACSMIYPMRMCLPAVLTCPFQNRGTLHKSSKPIPHCNPRLRSGRVGATFRTITQKPPVLGRLIGALMRRFSVRVRYTFGVQ